MANKEKEDKGEESKPQASNIGKEPSADAITYGEEVESAYETAASLAESSRAERKRHREKQRRSDVNKGLDQLMELVFIIDPQLKFEAEERARKASGGRTASTDAPILSRVELINSAVATLERVHHENEQRKIVITHLAGGLLAGGNGNGGGPPPDPAGGVFPPMPPFPTARDMQVSTTSCFIRYSLSMVYEFLTMPSVTSFTH